MRSAGAHGGSNIKKSMFQKTGLLTRSWGYGMLYGMLMESVAIVWNQLDSLEIFWDQIGIILRSF